MKRRGLTLSVLLAFALQLSAQEVDTTSLGYQAGYHIGSWLPFAVIAILAVMVIIKSSRQSRDS